MGALGSWETRWRVMKPPGVDCKVCLLKCTKFSEIVDFEILADRETRIKHVPVVGSGPTRAVRTHTRGGEHARHTEGTFWSDPNASTLNHTHVALSPFPELLVTFVALLAHPVASNYTLGC